MEINAEGIITLARAAKQSAIALRQLNSKEKNKALLAMADTIIQQQENILAANKLDLVAAEEKNLSAAMKDRLLLTPDRIRDMSEGIRVIAALPEPVGEVLAEWDAPSGLTIKRISVPLGVIAVIYEARPNVTADAAALCLKSGNACILRSGSEAINSSRAIHAALQDGLTQTGIDKAAIQLLPTQDYQAVNILLQLDQYIDVVIPRGGKKLIEAISSNSKIPLFKHLEGICHTYIHHSAGKELAQKITYNAKMRRTGICGATETILIDRAVLLSHGKPLLSELLNNNCEVRGDAETMQCDSRITAATEEDWSTEYLAPIVSVKVVADLSEAIAHIEQYSSQHTEAIIAEDMSAVAQFFNTLDSAILIHNGSTQFADGAQFGMGAEIGISTGKMHARGPVGIEQLTTFKYLVEGHGLVRP